MDALPYILLINGSLLALLLVWIVASKGWERLMWKMFPKRIVVPPHGAKVKIRTLSATYHSRFMATTAEGWAIETLANAIPTIRLGEPTVVEISCPRGVLRFRTELVELRTSHNATIMRPPLETVVGNRRNRRRLVLEERPAVYLDGTRALVHDVSEAGARVSTNHQAHRGERIRVDIPGSNEAILGHVLEVLPHETRGYTNDLRIVFEQPMPLSKLKKKFAPAR